MTITCDGPTSHFSSGCELVLHYDVDNDGLINLDELNQSYADFENGIITEGEFDFVSDAYIHGGINVVCPGCYISWTQNFVVYDRISNPVVGEWVVHAEILSVEDDSLIAEKTCEVSMSGSCSIEIGGSLLVNTWLKAYATKGSETTVSASTLPPCMYDTLELWQKAECDLATPNHASGRDMLLYWDKDKNGMLGESEIEDAMLAYLGYTEEEMSINEFVFVIECYEDYGGVINDICPPTVTVTFLSVPIGGTVNVDGI